MGIGRASKIAAGIVFILASLGVATPVLLVPIGLGAGRSPLRRELPDHYFIPTAETGLWRSNAA